MTADTGTRSAAEGSCPPPHARGHRSRSTRWSRLSPPFGPADAVAGACRSRLAWRQVRSSSFAPDAILPYPEGGPRRHTPASHLRHARSPGHQAAARAHIRKIWRDVQRSGPTFTAENIRRSGAVVERVDVADKAYSSKAIRSCLRRRGIKATIPEPADQIRGRLRRGSKGGRPPGFDPAAYKQRNTVERAFCRLRQHRAVVTRYDKRDFVYRGTADVAAIRIWLCDLTKEDPRDRP
jgi:transposase